MSDSDCRVRSIRRAVAFGAFGIATAASVTPVWGQPYHVRAHTRVTTSGFGVCDPQYNDSDTTRVQALSISSGPFTAASGLCEDATATAYGYSELGVLRGYCSHASSAADAPAGGACQGTPESWGDTLTFHSNSLPMGAPVSFEATLTFNRTLVGNGAGTIAQTSVAGPFGMSFSDSLANPNPTQTVTANSSWFIGFPMAVDVSLYFEASGTAHPQGGSASGSVTVQSVVFTLKTTTPDTSYTTASGLSYVPLLDADVNLSGTGNGADIESFTAAILAGSTAASDLYHADFDGSGIIDGGDVEGFAAKLVSTQ